MTVSGCVLALWLCFTLLCFAVPQAFTHEDLRRNDPDCACLSSLNQALKKMWPCNCPQWVLCLRDFAAQKKAERKEKHAAVLATETTAGQSPETTEAAAEALETAAEAPVLARSSAALVRAIGKAARVLTDGLFVGDIVVLDNSVGKDFRGLEAQVVRVSPKSVKVTMLHGKGTAEAKNFDPSVCKVVQPSTLRLKLGRQSSSGALSAVDAPATAESAASAPATPDATTIKEEECEAALAKAWG